MVSLKSEYIAYIASKMVIECKITFNRWTAVYSFCIALSYRDFFKVTDGQVVDKSTQTECETHNPSRIIHADKGDEKLKSAVQQFNN